MRHVCFYQEHSFWLKQESTLLLENHHYGLHFLPISFLLRIPRQQHINSACNVSNYPLFLRSLSYTLTYVMHHHGTKTLFEDLYSPQRTLVCDLLSYRSMKLRLGIFEAIWTLNFLPSWRINSSSRDSCHCTYMRCQLSTTLGINFVNKKGELREKCQSNSS